MNARQILNMSTTSAAKSATMKYVIALGSNMGDRFGWIEKACREMEAAGIRICATSGLFQTTAMYVENQEDFLNGVCVIETDLPPLELMKTLQGVENKLGRVKVIDKGPRNIDLDILLWEHGEFRSESPDLTIPHKLMSERDFVLAPLCQLLPPDNQGQQHLPTSFKGPYYHQALKHLRHDQYNQKQSEMKSLITTRTPLCDVLPTLVPDDKAKETHIMSILNLTPDSFSDGGRHAIHDQEYLRKTIMAHLQGGATIIDLGAQSSRPGAPDITADEEIERLTPALDILASLRQDPSTPPFSISIDTYRATVAEAAVNAGADIVNDISAGLLDSEMLPTIARLGCTYIMMHMRGTPHTMTSKGNTTYDRPVPSVIKEELLDRVIAAEAAGIRRWRLILDPGIGFAKTADQNLEILRRFPRFANRTDENPSVNAPGKVADGAYRSLAGIPWLAGSSRKGFIGKITGVAKASERTWGTAATVTAAVRGGADIVRVHDVAEMTQVVRMSEAIYRPRTSAAEAEE